MTTKRGRKFVERLIRSLRAFHGFDISYQYTPAPEAGAPDPIWDISIPDTGARYLGPTEDTIAWLEGYQAGWLGGRRYTAEEGRALLAEARDISKTTEA